MLHGIPAALLEAVETSAIADERRAVLNAAIARGCHLPSLMIALLVLSQLSEVSMASEPLYGTLEDRQERALRQSLYNSVFDEYVLDNAIGMLSHVEVVRDVEEQLSSITISASVYNQLEKELAALPLCRLQGFWLFLVGRGHCEPDAPPSWLAQRDRAFLLASLGVQRAAGDSHKGLDHLLPPGLGREEHNIRQAARLKSTFPAHTHTCGFGHRGCHPDDHSIRAEVLDLAG